MDDILKFILYARKHPEKELHRRFKATRALGMNKDYDWSYEEHKSDWVQLLCTTEAPTREVKKAWKKYHKKMCFYDAFYNLARQILKDGKRKDYKPSWTDLLY